MHQRISGIRRKPVSHIHMGTKGAQVLKASTWGGSPTTLRDLLNAALKRQDERAKYLKDEIINDDTRDKWYRLNRSFLGLQAIAASGAILPHVGATYVITKSSAAADMTLAAPTATTDDGLIIVVTSNTAKAHTITATGLLQPGTAATDVATFAAQPGCSITLMAYQAKWNVISSNGATFS